MKSTSLKTEPWIAWIIHHFITTTLKLEMIQQPNVKNLQMNSQCDADVGKLWGKSEESRGKTWDILKWYITQTSRVSSNRGNENKQLLCMAWTFWGHTETSHFLIEKCVQRSYSDSPFLAPTLPALWPGTQSGSLICTIPSRIWKIHQISDSNMDSSNSNAQ